jgi:transposase-like protein
MARGRPPKGPRIVDDLDGSEHAKKRLKIILETLTGERGIDEACEVLGVSRAAFNKMRSKWLESAVSSLEPKPSGRPAKTVSEEQKRIADLEAELAEMRMHIVGAQIREEIALAMPHLLVDKPGVGKKKAGKKRKKKRRK